jgi:predicted nucleic acid-binding protein
MSFAARTSVVSRSPSKQVSWHGKANVAYRRRGGTRRSSIADFYIAAHAAIAGHRLLTREAKRYESYFPTVAVISPE